MMRRQLWARLRKIEAELDRRDAEKARKEALLLSKCDASGKPRKDK